MPFNDYVRSDLRDAKCSSTYVRALDTLASELLSNLVFESSWSCGDLVLVCGFNSVFERDAVDDFGEVFKAA